MSDTQREFFEAGHFSEENSENFIDGYYPDVDS